MFFLIYETKVTKKHILCFSESCSYVIIFTVLYMQETNVLRDKTAKFYERTLATIFRSGDSSLNIHISLLSLTNNPI